MGRMFGAGPSAIATRRLSAARFVALPQPRQVFFPGPEKESPTTPGEGLRPAETPLGSSSSIPTRTEKSVFPTDRQTFWRSPLVSDFIIRGAVLRKRVLLIHLTTALPFM